MPERSPTASDIPLFIGMAGGSGSGKSTIAEALVEHLDGEVAVVQHDAYYRHTPRLSFEERTRVNYDHPASLETELLIEHLTALRAGESIDRPVYDFAKHLRSEQVVVIGPARYSVVEGSWCWPSQSCALSWIWPCSWTPSRTSGSPAGWSATSRNGVGGCAR